MHKKLTSTVMVQSSSEINTENSSVSLLFEKWTSPLKQRFLNLFTRKILIVFLIGLLLGRAHIFDDLAPFAIAYFAVIYHLRRDQYKTAFIGILIGSLLREAPYAWEAIITLTLCYLLQKMLNALDRDDITYSPFLALLSSFAGSFIYMLLANASLSIYAVLMIGVESTLALVLAFIFIQSLPIFLQRHPSYQLKQEEIICLLILLASVMTGTVGWVIEGYSIEHILSRYFILLLALVGGGAMGATAGVITGLILSLADIKALTQMSLLGFSGLLAGIFYEGKKLGVSLGLFMGTSILTVYTGDQAEMWISSIETCIAVILLLITPKSLIQELAKFVPGTKEHFQSQQEYVKRVRDMTAERVLQFSNVFRQLAKSFAQTSFVQENLEDVKTDYFLSVIADHTCQHCWKKEHCWSKQFDYTYRQMKEMIHLLNLYDEIPKRELDPGWRNTCVKLNKVMDKMQEEHFRRKQEQKLNHKIREARSLVADQLMGVSKVMVDFSKEILKEGREISAQERQIMEALESLGLKIQRVEIVSLEHGKVDIRILQPSCGGRNECAKIIAPMISDILDENIVVSEKGCTLAEGGCLMQLVSSKDYEVCVGVAQAAKGGGLISGDSYATLDLGNGKYAVAISDGMGNGARAFTESSATLSLLQQILQTGLDEGLAIKTVNSVLSLRSTDEIFATVDLALIDLHNARTKLLKIGSAPSFIKRGEHVRSISASNLPIGILEDIEIDVIDEPLAAGDLLIMMTDGIYEANREVENQDAWLKRIIREIETDDPQEVADLLLEKVIRTLHNQIHDDMTIVVSRIDRFIPKWSTITLPNTPKLERTKLA